LQAPVGRYLVQETVAVHCNPQLWAQRAPPRTKSEHATLSLVANQMNCTVTLTGNDGVEHSVEVTAATV
jgi:hypothetical protein